MPTYLEILPSMDLVFKALVVENPELLQGILQGTLCHLPPEELENPQILNAARIIRRYDEKAAVVDVKLKTKKCKLIALEMQRDWKKYLPNRTLYTLCDMVVSQVKKGDADYKMEDAIVIVICDFVWDARLTGYHHIAKLRYDSGEPFTDKLSIHLLELPKVPSLSDGTLLWHYLKFIKSRTKEEFDMLITDIPGMEKALEDLERLQADEELREYLRVKEKDIATRNSEIVFARDEGREEGLEMGLEMKHLEIIRNSLINKLPLETIIAITGATPSEIEAVKKELPS